MFDLASDTSAIAEHFRCDPLLGPLVERYPGLRVPGAWDGFELAVRAVLGQQISVAAASTAAGQVARQFGERLSVSDSGGLTHVFPAAVALANAVLPGLTRVRAQAIRALARAVVSGHLTLSDTEEDSLTNLARIRGIGHWTAQYIAMRALREPDAFPVNDLGLLRAAVPGSGLHEAPGRAASENGLATLPGKLASGDLTPLAELRARAERWRPWRAYAAVYLWRAASRVPDKHAARG
jgi:AraC family transcriptional regulator of adaptative response / DNA-3-methyladenine glycosylase II